MKIKKLKWIESKCGAYVETSIGNYYIDVSMGKVTFIPLYVDSESSESHMVAYFNKPSEKWRGFNKGTLKFIKTKEEAKLLCEQNFEEIIKRCLEEL